MSASFQRNEKVIFAVLNIFANRIVLFYVSSYACLPLDFYRVIGNMCK